jgi:hypothetical protein
MKTTPEQKRRPSPLLYPAVFLSTASLAWTTWSLVDLLGTGWIGVTVATGSDIVWGAVILAEARGLRIAGRSWIVPAIGWATLLTVAVFLAAHGVTRDSLAMAAAGPFLPLGAKVVWALALADMRDPAALTHDELHQLARMERGMVFEEAEHGIRMRQQRMRAELLMAEVSTDFDIEVMRQDRARDLRHRAPLAITSGSDQPFDRVADQAIGMIGDQGEQSPNIPSKFANESAEQIANRPLTGPNQDRERPSIADLVREQIATTTSNAAAVRQVLALRPDANKDSVAAAVRRERRKTEMRGGYG